MIEGLKPYAEYKDSGQQWLGDIPAHWDLFPNRALFFEVKDRNHSEEEMLSVTITRGIIRQNFLLTQTSKKDSSNRNKTAYKLVKKNDIAYNKMRAWQGALGASNLHGIVSPAYVVMRPKGQINPWFYHFLYRTSLFAKEAERWSYGITSDMWSLRPEHFKTIVSVLPPADEQVAIVRFLNHVYRKIDEFVYAKKKLIGLLNEQKHVIIQRAVTRGLNPDVKLKPSGVPWLGDIPEHWRITPLGRLCTSRCDGPFGSGLKSSHYVESGVRVVRLQNIGSAEFKNRTPTYIDKKHYASLGDHGVIAGDLLVAGLGDDKNPAGRACVAPAGIEPAMVKADCFRFRLYKGVAEVQYLSLHLSATAIIATSCLSTGATRLRINLSIASDRAVALPPLSEQQKIVSYIDLSTAPLTVALARTEREIALMLEYRTRLTADIVTGKLDVREAAAALPEAGELPETLPDVMEGVEEFDEDSTD